MGSDGWRVGFAPALRTSSGREEDASALCTSAGVLVAAPLHVGFEPLQPFAGWDLSPAGATARVAVGWADVMGGMAIISAYFWHSEGWSCRNQAIMSQIITIVRRLGCLWVLGADFNMEPDELQSHELYDELRGLLVAPGRGTCFGRGSWRCYDYFLVDPRLGGFIVAVEVIEEAHTAPHLPVRLRLKAAKNGLWKRVQVRPRALLTACPVGCPRPLAQ